MSDSPTSRTSRPFDFDVVVLGGGVHGVGVAQAAAAAGYSVSLLEKSRLAHGTSSRSSKLIHGGLRYLETAQLGLVRESLLERTTLLRIAPGLVHLEPFYLPIYRQTTRRPWQIRVGLSLYATLGSFGPGTRFSTVPKRRWGALDGLSTDGLQKVFRYHDAQTDDAALTRAVARSAEELGAEIREGALFLDAQRVSGGYRIGFEAGGSRSEVSARTVVNATGPWVNRTLGRVQPLPPMREMDLVQGTHIIVPGSIAEGLYYIEAPSDARAVFVMPHPSRVDRTLVGTTETMFDGDPERVRPLPAEVAYLQETFHRYFPHRSTEVVDSFAGLRVLPEGKGRAFSRPREVVLLGDRADDPRLITLYGGKLTGYRLTALKVVKQLQQVLPERASVADTAKLRLTGDS